MSLNITGGYVGYGSFQYHKRNYLLKFLSLILTYEKPKGLNRALPF